ncbi:hypothetical protein J2X19_001385 [Rhodoferax ferrireducens]|uniref:Uncharacterized protein n=1 Tax=Rhodoferax ferrireducens TaxID=192843 RepID=A0ABU2C658_9BURK|nr:hypothetical protein [Rhodoferax ferrireducens]
MKKALSRLMYITSRYWATVLFAQGVVEVFEAYGLAVYGVGDERAHSGVEVPVVAYVL